MTGTHTAVVRVAGLVRSAERIGVVLGRRPDGGTDRLWHIPGGKPEPGEDAEFAVQRELWEELAILPRIPRLLVTTWRPPHADVPGKRTFLYDYGQVHPGGLIRNDAELAKIDWIDPRNENDLARLMPGEAYRVRLAVAPDTKPIITTLTDALPSGEGVVSCGPACGDPQTRTVV